ncbi:MAG: tetratricopeptide repeat protein [Puia sp.]|nr:tetratricopeptide repeat protein [Puia sp.]
MTPNKHQQLIDLFDRELSEARLRDTEIRPGKNAMVDGSRTDGSQVDGDPVDSDPDQARERAILGVAVDAIRLHALSAEVKSVAKMYKGEGESGVEDTTGRRVEAHVETSGELRSLSAASGGATVRRLSISSRRIAAILVFAVCLGGAGKFLFTSPSGVFDTYYSPYTMGSTRGAEGLSTLEKAYQDKDWSSVIHTFQFTRSKTGKDYFLTGMAYMERKEYYEAIGLFKNVIASNEQSKEAYFQDEAEYYLAMSYLATHQTAQALPLLDKIKSDPHHVFNKQVAGMSGIDLLILRAK